VSFHEKGLKQLILELSRGEISAVETAAEFMRRIVEYDDEINAFITVNDNLIAEAGKVSSSEDGGELRGIPLAVKDNISTENLPTTCSSRAINWDMRRYNAEAVQAIVDSGGLIAGKTNLNELGMVSASGQNALLVTVNPWNKDYLPGGSSGGSAAAVAAGMVPAALGSDTGGSIRMPACHCGVVGLKPTYSLVSRHGLIAFAPSLDQIGPITRSVEDAALLLDIIADRRRLNFAELGLEEFDLSDLNRDDLSGLKFGLATNYLEDERVEADVRESVRESIEVISALKGRVENVKLPSPELVKSIYYIIAHGELFKCLTEKEDFGDKCFPDDAIINRLSENVNLLGREVKFRILCGSLMQSEGYERRYFARAVRIRTLLIKKMRGLMSEYDIILTPTSPTIPGKKSEGFSRRRAGDHDFPDFTILANLTGLPAMTLPCGFSTPGLPVGLQFMSDFFQDKKMLAAAALLEEELELPSLAEPEANTD